VLSPVQFERLLRAADVRLQPIFALSAFAGLRPAEVYRLNWEAINFQERLISVSAKTSKTASRRLVPISDNLLEWLLLCPSRIGPVAILKPSKERKLIKSARKRAEIREWPQDALRHSWATYRFALTGDAARTAAEAGHDESVLHRHYRALASRADAERWFAIRPKSCASEPVEFKAALALA
jgi:integrase